MTWTRSRFLLSRLDYSTDQLHKLLIQGFRTEVNFLLKTLFFILFELTWNKDFNLWMISGLMFCLLTYKVWSSNQLCVWAFNIEILPEDRDWETNSAYLRPEGKTEKEIVGLWSKQSVLCWFPSMCKKLSGTILATWKDSYVNSLRPVSASMCQCETIACKRKRCEDAGFSCASQAGHLEVWGERISFQAFDKVVPQRPKKLMFQILVESRDYIFVLLMGSSGWFRGWRPAVGTISQGLEVKPFLLDRDLYNIETYHFYWFLQSCVFPEKCRLR